MGGEPFGAGCTSIKIKCLGCKLCGHHGASLEGHRRKSITVAVRRESIQYLAGVMQPKTQPAFTRWLPHAFMTKPVALPSSPRSYG